MLIGLIVILLLVGVVYIYYIKPRIFPIIEEVYEGFASPKPAAKPPAAKPPAAKPPAAKPPAAKPPAAKPPAAKPPAAKPPAAKPPAAKPPAAKPPAAKPPAAKPPAAKPPVAKPPGSSSSSYNSPAAKPPAAKPPGSSSSSSSYNPPAAKPPAAKPPGSSSSSSSYNPTVDRPATIAELTEFKARIQAEMDRLSASGATDALTQQRIRSLEKVKEYVQQIMDEVESKQLPENRIPIMKSSIDAAFKSLSSNSPLPDVFDDSQINAYLKGILPDNMAQDPEVAQTIADYLRSFTTNLSWNFGVKYVSDAERDLATAYNNRANQEGGDIQDENLAMAGSAAGHLPESYGNNAQVSDEFANTPQEACRGPSSFDWKKRSNEICRALNARGLDTKDYGCMPDDVEVGPAFSYKGYARMICTRIASNYDTGLGSLVGCPPLDWPGWRLK